MWKPSERRHQNAARPRTEARESECFSRGGTVARTKTANGWIAGNAAAQALAMLIAASSLASPAIVCSTD
jgi:hypothetical protein